MQLLHACILLASQSPWMEGPAEFRQYQETLTIKKALALAIVKRRREATSTIEVRQVSRH